MSRLKVALPGCARAAVLAWMAIVTTAWPALGAAEVADKARPTVGWDLAKMSAPKSYPVEDASISNEYGRIEGVSPVWIEGEDYCGKPTRVFAWWGVPKGASAERKAPAMVLVHGGGGTAFADWVKTWVDRGYAAIAMDTCGGAPRGEADGKLHPRHPWSGPYGWQDSRGYDRGGLTDEWPYQAVSAVIRCHSFLRNRPEVDAGRIGITGISWGGYLTSIIMGVDGRFAFAAPVYGCGWYDRNAYWDGSFKHAKWQVEDKAEVSARLAYGRWLRDWDARNFIGRTKCPVLRCNGTRDVFYTMEMTELSMAALPSGTTAMMSIKNPMPHGHGACGDPKEIAAWADFFLKGGPKPLEIVGVRYEGARFAVSFCGNDDRAVAAELVYTTDADAPNPDREWKTCAAAADLAGGEVVFTVPDPAQLFFANIRTAKGEIYSTRLFLAPQSRRF